MSTPVPLRSDFDAIGLRMLARRSRDPDQTRRLLALAEIYGGGSRPDAARIGGVGVPIVRDWVVRFNAKGPDGLLTGKAPGAPRRAPAPSLAAGRGRWADSRPAWRRALAADRSSAVALRRVPGLDLEADAQLRAAAYGHTPSSRRDRAIMSKTRKIAAAFKKTFSPSWRKSPRTRLAARR